MIYGTNCTAHLAGVVTIIPNIQTVLAELRRYSLPVFHIPRIHRSDGSDVEIIWQELFRKKPFAVAGSLGAAIIDELAPDEQENPLTKTRMSAFINTELDLMLGILIVTNIVVYGFQTANCIRTTVFDAFAYNYHEVVVGDETGTVSDEVHR